MTKQFIKDYMKAAGGRKMAVFIAMFLTITSLFIFKYDIKIYGEVMMPFVAILVIGNVGEHLVTSKKSE